MELLDADTSPVTVNGQVGRIVATNFTNRALPLIRYDTGDLGTFTTAKCTCGRGTPVIISSVEGRHDDLIVGVAGQFLPSVNFYTLFAHLEGQVKRFQLIQNDKSKFCLKLIRGPEFKEDSTTLILKGLRARIGGNPEITIEDVDKIEPTRSGKIRAVVREYEPHEQSAETTYEN
jgi:phenylacetate-CoA ligase